MITTKLDVYSFACRKEISQYVLADAPGSAELRIEQTARGMVLELHAFIAGRKASGVIVQYPRTWWDYTKWTFFRRGWLAWILRRWPVQWTCYTPKMTEYFPDLKPIAGQRSIVIREWERNDAL